MTVKVYVKVITFTVAAALLLLAVAISGSVRAARYGQQVRSGYLRAVNGLAESISAVDVDLHKCICAGTGEGYAERAAQLWADTQAGKIYALELTHTDGALEGVERFLTQAGDYALCIGQGEALTEEQYDRLIALSEYAAELRLAVEELAAAAGGEGNVDAALQSLRTASDEQTASLSGLLEDERVLPELPKLIYDGAFSDHILERSPQLISQSEEVTAAHAQKTAETALGERLCASGQSDGRIQEYIFTTRDGRGEAAVTKRGGRLSWFLRDVAIGQTMCSPEEAEQAAQRFLRSLGYRDFVRVQYATYSGLCVFSFAAQQYAIVLYPDQIKVGVALDCGDVVSFDAREYIMNHHERGVLTAKKTCADAQQVVSDMLTVTDSRLVLIPTDGMEERLCYEFFCRRWDGGEAAVYISADTLREERIYLLSRTADGFMAT